MPTDVNQVDPDFATAFVRELIWPKLTVTNVRLLPGGTRHAVYEWITDGEPGAIVAKLTPAGNDPYLHQEMAALHWYRQHTRVPVPEPYLCVTHAAGFEGTCLLMQRLRGRVLSAARLSAKGKHHLQRQLAQHVAELHSHRREQYGSPLTGEETRRWLDHFAPTMRKNFDSVRDRLSARSQWAIAEIIDQLERWLPEFHQPTLVHGDLWANNIIVDDLEADRPTLSGFIDGNVNFSEIEYELAYLRVFNTVDDTFFNLYTRTHLLRRGFEQRCRLYWLNTAMTHVTTFGPHYLTSCEDLANQLYKMLPR